MTSSVQLYRPGREEAPILIRTKPSAEMTLTLNKRSVIGKTVQLGDPITIDVELLPQFRGNHKFSIGDQERNDVLVILKN